MARLRTLVFVGSIFTSAFLLFLIQPLVARLLLPLYGGSPAIWNLALVFFQGVLLAGYLYASAMVRIRSRRVQWLIHLPVLLLPVLVLPPHLPASVNASEAPIRSILLSLAVAVGLPFFSLASNSTMVQHWFAGSTPSKRREDPYWLYGASNTGSLLALVAYPLVLEPLLAGPEQRLLWTRGYALFLLLTAAVGLASRGAAVVSGGGGAQIHRSANASVGWRRRVSWATRAAIASSLLLAVSMRISTDVAATPLLWVIPLGLYLLSFIVAFSGGDRLPRDGIAASAAITACAALGLVLIRRAFSPGVVLVLTLPALFCGALLAHADLARDRPHPANLGEFYLWISLGGVVGGILNSLVAPVLFRSVAEYPLTLVAVLAMVVFRPAGEVVAAPQRARLYRPGRVTAAACALVLLAPAASAPILAGALPRPLVGGLVLLIVSLGLILSRYAAMLAVVPALAAGLALSPLSDPFATLDQERSFFGVSRVWVQGDRLLLMHGSTVHGSQTADPTAELTSGTYYHRAGPLGSLVDGAAADAVIGIVGLGTGELAALGRPHQTLRFYEIDPVVIDFAQRHFRYLATSPAKTEIIQGDGRTELAQTPDATFARLIIDAFSGDNVPVHLLTAEALQMYLGRLTEDGILVVHISSRHTDLRGVLAGFSARAGTSARYADFEPDTRQGQEGAVRTVAIALARSESTFRSLDPDLWQPMPEGVEPTYWTDDRASLLAVVRRGGPPGISSLRSAP